MNSKYSICGKSHWVRKHECDLVPSLDFTSVAKEPHCGTVKVIVTGALAPSDSKETLQLTAPLQDLLGNDDR